jgi:phosphatidylglycerol:prolipoprotein diacylglycerol transferase
MALTLSSLCYALGYAAGIAGFFWMARRRGLATTGVFHIMLGGLLGGLFFANLTQFITTGHPGKTILGGIAGGYLCVVLIKRHLGITRTLGDLFAIGTTVGEAIGRWGCFFGGCCYGRPTNGHWGVMDDGVLRHPTQIYMSLSSLAILAVLLRYEKTKPPENAIFFLQGILYCISRFVIEFYRESTPFVLHLSLAQVACLVGLSYFSTRYKMLIWPRAAQNSSMTMALVEEQA